MAHSLISSVATSTPSKLIFGLIFSTFLAYSQPCWSDTNEAPQGNIVTGNALVPPLTLERMIRKFVAQALKGNFTGDKVSFHSNGIQQTIPLEPTGLLKDILTTLGMKSPIQIALDPLNTQITFPEDALKITIKNTSPNVFAIRAKWAINELSVSSENLGIAVPKGIFDQEFEINSKPVSFGLSKKSAPISIDLSISAELSEKGTSVRLNKLETNLLSDEIHFFAKLGPLTVNGQPLELEIGSNGKTLRANEATIREEFKKLEPSLLSSVKTKINQIIVDRFAAASQQIEGAPPIHFVLETNKLLKSINTQDPEKIKTAQALLGDIKADFLFSYMQNVKRYNLFSTQIATRICIESSCLGNIEQQSNIGIEDLKSMESNADVGVIAYESMLQNFVHSDTFQKRILDFYAKHPSPGVKIAKSGVRVHLNPKRNAAVVVLNLDIDIKKTGKPGSGAGQRLKLDLAKWIERSFGSGKIVTIPVEISGFIDGITKNSKGEYFLSMHTELPFHKDGTITNTYHYPSNVEDMVGWVKKGLLESVKDSIAPSIPPLLEIPLGTGVSVKGFNFIPKKILITPNRGLMITSEMKD